MTIAENIRKIRIEKGLTQKQLGNLCGIDAGNLRKYESGRLEPKYGTAQRIAEALDVTMAQLYGLDKQETHITEEFLTNNPIIYKAMDEYIKNLFANSKADQEYPTLSAEQIDSIPLTKKAEMFNMIFERIDYSEKMDFVELYVKGTSETNTKIDTLFEKYYLKLNDLGKKEALKRIAELTEIKKYTE